MLRPAPQALLIPLGEIVIALTAGGILIIGVVFIAVVYTALVFDMLPSLSNVQIFSIPQVNCGPIYTDAGVDEEESDDNYYDDDVNEKNKEKRKGKGKGFRSGSKKTRDNWGGINDNDFKRWWHRAGKLGKDLESSKEIWDEYDYWRSIGSPKVK